MARSLATVGLEGGSAFISMPLMYPGGAAVVVRIGQHGDRYFVSDVGMGRREAHLLGGDRIYLRIGQEIAARFGVAFDKDSFFSAETSCDDLVAAVTIIANSSKTAVEYTAYRIAERVASESREIMAGKLRVAFDPNKVILDYEFSGASNDVWGFDAALETEAGLRLFHVVTPAVQSVHSAIARFVDVSDMQETHRPKIVAVLENRGKTTHLRLVERSAATIDLYAVTSVWRKAAA